MKTYMVVDNIVEHLIAGILYKKKIQYFINGILEMEENYTNETTPRDGYVLTQE